MGKHDDDITPAVLLAHMQEMGASLRKEMQEGLSGVRREMQEGLSGVRREMHQGFADAHKETASLRTEMRQGFSRVENRLEWHSAALKNIDKRLDDLELAQLHKRVSRLERTVFAGKGA